MKRFELIFMVLQVPVDFLMLVFAGVMAYYLRFTDWALALRPVLFDLTAPQYMEYVIQVAPIWIVIYALIGLYTPSRSRRFAQDVLRIILGTLAGLAFVAMYILFTQQLFDSRFLVAATSLLAVLWVTVGRLGLRALKGLLYRSGYGLRRAVIIGSDEIAKQLHDVFAGRPEFGYQIVGTHASFSEGLAKKLKKLRIDEIIVTNPRKNESSSLAALEYANEAHIGFKYSADLFSTLAANRSVHPLAGVPMVEVKRTRLEGWGRIVKRVFDIIVSIVMLIILSPIIIGSAFFILIETGLPIIYKNKRVGVRGKEFVTYKFRSMYQKDSTGDGFGGKAAMKREQELIKKQNSKKGPIYKVEDDPRVTPIGKILRGTSIDEIPQFWNVLIGNMSVVGPRPHQPREVQGYDKKHKLAFSVKPGITGLAQISGRSDLTYEEEMRLDILYIEKWSLWLDLIICIKTPFIILKRRKVA